MVTPSLGLGPIDFILWVSGSGGGYPHSQGGPPTTGEMDAAEFFRLKLGRAFFYRERGGYGTPYKGMPAGQTKYPIWKEMDSTTLTWLQRNYAGISTNLKTYGGDPQTTNNGGLLQDTLDGYFDPYIGHTIDDLNTLGALGIRVYIELWSEQDVGNAGSNQPPAADGPWADALGPSDIGARNQFRDWVVYWHDHIVNGTTAHPTGLLYDNVIWVASLSSSTGWTDSGTNKANVFLKPTLDWETAHGVTIIDVIGNDTYNHAGQTKTPSEMFTPGYNYAVAHGKLYGIFETGYAAAPSGAGAATLALKPSWYDDFATWLEPRKTNVAVITMTMSELLVPDTYTPEVYIQPVSSGLNGYTSPSWAHFDTFFNTDSLFAATTSRVTRTHQTTAVIRKSGLTKTHQTTAVIRKAATRVHATDAIISKRIARTHGTDAIIGAPNARAHGTLGVVRKALTRAQATDAVVGGVVALPSIGWGAAYWGLSDWGGVGHILLTQGSDAVIAARQAVAHGTDARLLKVSRPPHDTDAVIRKAAVLAQTADAVIKAPVLVSMGTDAIIQPFGKVLQQTDAYVSQPGKLPSTTDAVVSKVATKAQTTDAIIRKAATKAQTTTAVVAARMSKTLSTDAVVRRGLTVAHGTDAVIPGGANPAQATDAVIRVDLAPRIQRTDAVVSGRHQRDQFTDAYISTRLVHAQRTDAVLQGVAEAEHLTDASIAVSGLTVSMGTDAYLFDEYPYWPADETALTISWGVP